MGYTSSSLNLSSPPPAYIYQSLIDMVPPPPKSEIPRTPHPSSASLVAKVAKTPTIKATPTSPSPGTSTGRHGTTKEGTSTVPGPPSCTSCNSNGEVLVLEREVRQIPPRKCVTAENIARRQSAIPTAVTLVEGGKRCYLIARAAQCSRDLRLCSISHKRVCKDNRS